MIRRLLPMTSRAIWLWALVWIALTTGFFISKHSGLPVFTSSPAPMQITASHHTPSDHSTGRSDTHADAAINSHSSSHQQNCQTGSNQSCHDTAAHQSNDCLWQCLLVCLVQMLLFVMCFAIGLKIHHLAYRKLAPSFKSSLLKRMLKPPKNLTVFA